MTADPGVPPPDPGQYGGSPGVGDPGRVDPDQSGAEPDAPASGDPDSQQAGTQTYTDAASQIVGRWLALQNRTHERAMADFLGDTTINGPVYIGDQRYELAFGDGDSPIRARRITEEERRAPFVRTAALDRLRDSLDDQPLVVLQAPRGYGKGAALVWALSRDLRADATILFLDPSTELATFSCAGFPEQSILILPDLPDSAADRLDAYTAERIESELRTRRCRLGITTSSKAVRLATASTRFLVAELDTRPEPREVFRRHLSEALLGTRVSRDDVERWPGVADLLDDELGESCGLADAARLAMLLSRARDEPDIAAGRVRTQLTEYANEKVALWFRRLDGLPSHCMAISLAVLNGLSRELVAKNAWALETRILPPPSAANAPPHVNPFATSATVSLSLLNAKVANEEIDTEHGPVFVQTMAYREPGYPGRVLRHVWREYDAGRAAICAWLRDLGRSADLDVRVRAATAVGVLARDSMDYLYQQVLLGWARDGRADVRASAAIALGPAADDGRLGATVRSLVEDWASPGSRWQLRATAARVYGRTIGLRNPTLALRSLSGLAESGGLDVMVAISNSYCELILDGTSALAARVLSEVVRLAAEREPRKHVAGRLSALGLTYLRGAPAFLEDRFGPRVSRWPTLLLLALSDRQAAESAARLWQLSLHDPEVGAMVTDSLDEWAKAADNDRDLRVAFTRFTSWIGDDDRSRRAVLRRARGWSGRDGEAPKTGQAVIENLALGDQSATTVRCHRADR